MTTISKVACAVLLLVLAAAPVMPAFAQAAASREIPTVFNVTLSAVAKAIDANVRIEGLTNLPPGTMLRMSLVGGGRIFEQNTAVSEGGRFAFPLVPAPLGAMYDAGVTMLEPSLQPARVRRIIGERGERLRGASVTMLGGTIPIVNYEIQFRR